MDVITEGCPRVIAVVGAGAAGTLTAIHVLHGAARRGTPVEVVLLDPRPAPGRGVAFGTEDPRHLLNVPATGMSAFPDEPGHFAAWLDRRGVARPEGVSFFAPRAQLARYLEECLDEAAGTALGVAVGGADGCVRLRHERTCVVGLRSEASSREAPPHEAPPHEASRPVAQQHESPGCVLELADGGELRADAVVVATGLPSAGDSWAPPALRDHPAFVADPWRAGALDAVRDEGDVLVVGTGLTMVDVVLSLTGPGSLERRVHAVSRRGLLPKVHRPSPTPPVVPDVTGWGDTPESVRAAAERHVRDVLAATGDWRAAVDGLRFRLAELWGRLDDGTRLALVRHDVSRWNRLRHRMAPSSAATLHRLEMTGRLTRTAATVVDAVPLSGGRVRVTLSDGGTRDVSWVVNCTGPRDDVRTLGDLFLDQLLASGRGVVAAGGMGLRSVDGRLLDSVGSARAPVWTLGALRRGELWESVAVPEIRVQAQGLAGAVLDEVSRVLAPR